MKTFLFLSSTFLLLALIGKQTAAQDSISFPNRKLYIAIMVSPDLGYLDASSIEQFKIDCTAGINVGYQLKESIAIETGLLYYDKGYSTGWDEYYYFDPLDAPNVPPYNTYTPNTTIPDYYKVNYHFKYIGIPVNAIYQSGKLKWKFVANFGGSVDFLISTKYAFILEFENGNKEKVTAKPAGDYNPINVSLFAGIGVAYKLTKFSSISMIPTYNYGLLKIDDSNNPLRLQNTGLKVKYSYAIK